MKKSKCVAAILKGNAMNGNISFREDRTIKTHTRTLCGAAAMAVLIGGTTFAESWTFISSPDMFNSDIADLSGGDDQAVAAQYDKDYASRLVKAANWDNVKSHGNSINANMASTYNKLIREMVENAGGSPKAFLSAGDLINGRWAWSNGRIKQMRKTFTPEGKGAGPQAIDNAAATYYAWYLELFRQNGIETVIGAIGDHDIGDNDWPAKSPRANYVDDMKIAFGKYMVDQLEVGSELDKQYWENVTPRGPKNDKSDYYSGSFVKQVENVLFVTLDMFQFEGPGKTLHRSYGSVSANVSGTLDDPSTHLGWLETVLSAADADPSINHVILQGHTPVLDGVRKQASSGMMVVEREDSPFWKLLQQHDHQHGGKVRMYYGGEVHTMTNMKDVESDVVQMVHGNPPLGNGESNYVIFEVEEKKITAKMYRVSFESDGGLYWQVSKAKSKGPSAVSDGELAGTMVMDVSGPETKFQTTGYMNFVDHQGLLLAYQFEGGPSGGALSNTGTMGDLYYGVLWQGMTASALGSDAEKQAFTNALANSFVPGKFGDALLLDATGEFMRTAGGLSPIGESEQRTITAWVNTKADGVGTAFGMGQDGEKAGEFSLQVNGGVVQLCTGKIVTLQAENAPINDGEWHHIAVVVPNEHHNKINEIVFYVDGKPYATKLAADSVCTLLL